MKPACEKCNQPLQMDGVAYICSYECTYCKECTSQLENVCPNCNGELVRRPKRKAQTTEKN